MLRSKSERGCEDEVDAIFLGKAAVLIGDVAWPAA